MRRPAITPILVTADIERLSAFYTGALGAEVIERVPEEGDLFYLGLGIGDSVLGLVQDATVVTGEPVRVLISIAVDEVDGLLPRVEEFGGLVEGPPNDMPWGQRVAHVRDPDGTTVNLTQEITPSPA